MAGVLASASKRSGSALSANTFNFQTKPLSVNSVRNEPPVVSPWLGRHVDTNVNYGIISSRVVCPDEGKSLIDAGAVSNDSGPSPEGNRSCEMKIDFPPWPLID